jgi:tetratricopeptide (TPR) repeat protein
MLAGRRDESLAAFREIVASTATDTPKSDYARTYSRMVVAYFDDELGEADRLAVELKNLDGPRTLLPPLDRPSILAANAILERMKLHDADPLGFRDEQSGVRWMQGVKAYSKGEFSKALEHMEQAEAIRPATSAQKALKAGLLINLDRVDEAEQIFGEVISELSGAEGTDERYIRLFCELHRPSNNGSDRSRLLAQLGELHAQTSVSNFLPVETSETSETFETSDSSAIEAHFKRVQGAYGSAIIRPGRAKMS